ncbi:MAG: ABC transporter substrate-binding protein [Actinobacteria bacterium]|nr:MAG: ABC transporter substrate-binding protein [Actinomycetota bacterium]
MYRLTIRRVIALLALMSLLAFAVAGCQTQTVQTGGEEQAAEKSPYKIGAVISLTGTYAGLGGPEKNVIDMEVKRINDAGGVNGHPIEVIVEDDGTEEAKAVAAASRLIEKEKVLALIGATGTGQTMAMRGEVDKAGVPQVSMAGGTVITGQFDPLVFATPWSNTIVVPFTLKALQEQGFKKIAVISDSGGFGKDGVEVIKANVAKFGQTIVSEQTFNPGDTDMSSQLTKIKNSGADVILLWSAGKEASVVAKNRTQLKIATPLVGSHGNARKEFIAGSAEAGEGFRFAAGKILIPDTYGQGTEEYKVATEFVDRYTKQFKDAPSTFAGHAYDALYLIVEAMKRLPEGFDSKQLRDEIEKTKGFVGIGGTFNFSNKDHNGLSESDIVMYEVKNGDWVLVK